MEPDERGEARKWLRLAHETHGPRGMAVMADALGLRRASGGGEAAREYVRAGKPTDWQSTATIGGGILPSGGAQPDARPPVACPADPPHGNRSWRPYEGGPWWFHCGYEGYLENRAPSPDWPIGECFYDEQGRLVDDGHPYAKCAGTPDSYPAWDPRHWLWQDPGGIWNNFGTLGESVRQRYDQSRSWLRDKGHDVPPSVPPKAPYPY